jgi:hypothetical protein
MLDAQDGRVWCSADCQNATMGWVGQKKHYQKSVIKHPLNCVYCQNPFRARRKDARFCSQRCRQTHARRTAA